MSASQTCCEHRRFVGECGKCPRHDLQAGAEVRVADDGSGAVTTWFDGIVASSAFGERPTVRVELFGEGTWDRVKPKYPPTQQQQQKQQKQRDIHVSLAPLGVGSSIVLRGEHEVKAAFEKKGWRLGADASSLCNARAAVAEVDREDGTLKLNFGNGVAYDRMQWWPADAVSVVAEQEEEEKEALAGPPPPHHPQPQPQHKDPVEEALVAARKAEQLYTLPEGTPDQCGHGTLRAECGKCPRFDLSQGDRVRVSALHTSTWFTGSVAAVHEFGYPILSIEGFPGESAWDRVRKEEPAARQTDLLCPHSRPEELCGRCPRNDLAVGEEVKVSTDGQGWTEGFVTARNPLVVTLAGCETGFSWDWVGPKVARPRENPEPGPTKQQCVRHGRWVTVCGECPRPDLKRGMRVKVSVAGSSQDTAVFDGIVSKSLPDLPPLVKVPGFCEEMEWDRVWSASEKAPLDPVSLFLPPRRPEDRNPGNQSNATPSMVPVKPSDADKPNEEVEKVRGDDNDNDSAPAPPHHLPLASRRRGSRDAPPMGGVVLGVMSELNEAVKKRGGGTPVLRSTGSSRVSSGLLAPASHPPLPPVAECDLNAPASEQEQPRPSLGPAPTKKKPKKSGRKLPTKVDLADVGEAE